MVYNLYLNRVTKRKVFDHQDLAEAQYLQLMVSKSESKFEPCAAHYECMTCSKVIYYGLFRILESFYRGHRRTQSNTSNISSISRVSYSSEHYYDRALVSFNNQTPMQH